MIRFAFTIFLFLLALSDSPAPAQPPRQDPPPRALVRQLFADVEADSDYKRNGIESVAAGTVVERVDLNGDGVGEWLVTGTRFCGTNCPYWVYRRLADGRFQQVYEGGGVRLEPLAARSHGWRSLMVQAHMSCCEAFFTQWQFDGRRYQWRDTEYRATSGRVRTIYHMAITDADSRGRRRLALDPVDAGGGLTIAARYDVCARSGRCGAPELVLRSAQLPAGRVCVELRSKGEDQKEYRSTAGGGWCGVTTGGAQARDLVLRPTRRDWAQLRATYEAELTGPGLPGRIESDAAGALMQFGERLSEVYTLPCAAGVGCGSAGAR